MNGCHNSRMTEWCRYCDLVEFHWRRYLRKLRPEAQPRCCLPAHSPAACRPPSQADKTTDASITFSLFDSYCHPTTCHSLHPSKLSITYSHSYFSIPSDSHFNTIRHGCQLPRPSRCGARLRAFAEAPETAFQATARDPTVGMARRSLFRYVDCVCSHFLVGE